MGRRRIDRPLTAGEQELAARAFAMAGRVVDRHNRRYGDRYVDWSGEVAEFFVRSIRLYDPAHSLEGWAVNRAAFACREAMRNKVPRPGSRKGAQRLWYVSLDAEIPGGGGRTYAGMLRAPGRPAGDIEDACHLLRGLRRAEREIVWASVVDGRTLGDIAREHGVDLSRISQVRTRALGYLRGRLKDMA